MSKSSMSNRCVNSLPKRKQAGNNYQQEDDATDIMMQASTTSNHAHEPPYTDKTIATSPQGDFLQKCSKSETNNTIGFIGIFYPKSIYHTAHVAFRKTPQTMKEKLSHI